MRAVDKPELFVCCMRIIDRKWAKRMCGSSQVQGVKAEQKQCKNILNSMAAVIRKNKRNAVGNGEKVVHPCIKLFNFLAHRQ